LGLSALWAGFPSAAAPLTVEAIPASLLISARLIQSIMGAAVVGLAYSTTRRLSDRHAAGLVAAGALALSPAFVREAAYIRTESTFILFLTAAIWLYLIAVRTSSRVSLPLAGVALGLACLTRPIAFLMAAALILPVVWKARGRGDRVGAALLVAGFALTTLPWFVYLGSTTGRPIPEGLASNLWIGAVGEGRWEGNLIVDQRRQAFGGDSGSYLQEFVRIVRADPLGWLTLRARNLTAAVLTPHGTIDLPGPSIKRMVGQWVAGDRSLQGLGGIFGQESFPLKLLIYAFHYFALVVGAIGAWVSRRRWRSFYPVSMGIVGLAVPYSLLTVEPRYLFPAEVFLWILAAVGAIALWARIAPGRGRSRAASPASSREAPPR
jgi:4-amino-4-deoxy-L-arabinose transferase-like glycosyltransferase